MNEYSKEALAVEYARVTKEFSRLVCSDYGCEYCGQDIKCTTLIRRRIRLLKMMEESDARH